MNSYYLFLTIHNSFDIDVNEIKKAIKSKYPDASITLSDDEFENVR